MKKNKVIYSLFALILILIPVLVSCMPPSTPAAPAATPLTAVQERLVKAEQDITRKADVGQFQALESRIIKLESTPAATAAGNTYAKAETYSKAEVDAAVKTAVDALKSNQTWITAQTTPTPQSPYGVPTTPVTPTVGGTVTMITNPTTLPQIFSGAAAINCTSGTPSTFTVTPTGYVQPYSMRITNGSQTIQYVRPVVTISTATQGNYYYGGSAYPQLIYFNVTMSSGYGMVQGTGTSNFCQIGTTSCNGTTSCGTGITTCASGPAFNGFCTWTAGGNTGSGWFVSSTTNPVSATGTGFPINLSPSNANAQPSPSFSFTPTAPSLNGYGEFMMTPGQTIDVSIQIQVATMQQATLQISNSISARQ